MFVALQWISYVRKHMEQPYPGPNSLSDSLEANSL
jgi:hypothetical protein